MKSSPARIDRVGSAAHIIAVLCSLALFASLPTTLVQAEPTDVETGPSHGFSALSRLKYPADFAHFDYVRPDAPKGGRIRIPGFGTFDTLNGFTRKGRAAMGVSYLRGQNYIYDSLAVASADEPESRYGLLAESFEFLEAGRVLRVTLRPGARWHDGTPLTSADVVFTFETLKSKATPTLRVSLAELARVTAISERVVDFEMSRPRDRGLITTVTDLPILPKHYWQDREFEETTLEPPLGSGPYRVAKVDPGRSLSFERVRDYWAKDLPVNVGQYNFDELRVEYFLDTGVRLEALKAGAIDYTLESVSKTWARGYDFPARHRGELRLDLVRSKAPGTVRALIFNTRVPKLKDVRVRKALSLAFDREWKNRVQTHDLYELGHSYFPSSDLAHRGKPSGRELALLEPFRAQLPAAVFEGPIEAPRTDGMGPNRKNLERALELLREAGYEIRSGVLVNRETGKPFTLELILDSSSRIRMSLMFRDALERLGIQTSMRVLETAQLLNRRRAFAFELIYGYYRTRSVPGLELPAYFSSRVADNPNSRNYAGVRDPIVDRLILAVLSSRDYDSLVAATRALDRVLLAGYYMIDLGYSPGARIAYWDRFGRPDHPPLYGSTFPEAWWYDEARAARIDAGARRRRTQQMAETAQ